MLDGGNGKVCTNISFAVRSNSKQEQTTAATNLQHAARFETQNAFNRMLNPLTHLLSRDRLTCVAAIPTGEVERRISNFSAVHVLIKLTPLRNMFGVPILIRKLSRTRLEFRYHVCDQSFV